MGNPMMKCGHAANARDMDRNPVCAICICTKNDNDARTIDDNPPSLEGRMARCMYYGRSNIVRNRREFQLSCNYNCNETLKNGGRHCKCEVQSSTELPFFEHKPGEPFDKFYCGCFGWD